MNQESKNSVNPKIKLSFVKLVEEFEKKLRNYQELANKEKNIFKTVKNNEKKFIEMVTDLNVICKELNLRIKDPLEIRKIPSDRLSYKKTIFNHYEKFFRIQKETAQTYLLLEKNKAERKTPDILGLRTMMQKKDLDSIAEIKKPTFV